MSKFKNIDEVGFPTNQDILNYFDKLTIPEDYEKPKVGKFWDVDLSKTNRKFFRPDDQFHLQVWGCLTGYMDHGFFTIWKDKDGWCFTPDGKYRLYPEQNKEL